MRFREINETQQTQYFVRFGELPTAERSGIGASPNHIHAMYRRSDSELGISVYPATWDEANSRWDLDLENITNIATLDQLLYQGRQGERSIYLVTGNWLEYKDLNRRERNQLEDEGRAYPGIVEITGSDGEPLIRNAKIVKQLHGYEVWAPGFDDEDDWLIADQWLRFGPEGMRDMGPLKMDFLQFCKALDTDATPQFFRNATYQGRPCTIVWTVVDPDDPGPENPYALAVLKQNRYPKPTYHGIVAVLFGYKGA